MTQPTFQKADAIQKRKKRKRFENNIFMRGSKVNIKPSELHFVCVN